jgi:hypothetical protein
MLQQVARIVTIVYCKVSAYAQLRRKSNFSGKQGCVWGRAIAQAVSRRLPTAAARVQTRV